MKLIKILILILGVSVNSFAHIGSAGVVHEGKAGNYQIQVYVEPPDVIPGTAKITVLTDGTDVRKISAKPIFYWSGDEGSPRSDELLPILGESGRFEGKIWLMSSGAASVQINIEGGRGQGQVLIPIMAVSTAQRSMPMSTGWILAALAVVLVGLMTTIIGASTGDSLLKPGENENKRIARRRIIGSSIGAVFCGGLLFVGNFWWNSWSDDYKQYNLYQPFKADSKVVVQNGQRILNFQIDSNSVKNRSLSYIIPDHGKLMHLFLVRQGTMDAFAHLHPNRKDTLNFVAALPNLPAGKYLVYADIMRYHGLQYTITDTVEIPNPLALNSNPLVTDTEDTYVVTNPLGVAKPTLQDASITICGAPGVKTLLQDGSSIVWERNPNDVLKTGQVNNLKFSIIDPSGKPAELQPYLGMMGHAAILKDDGSVYIHLHPNGTFSSTAVSVMQKRINETNRRPQLQSAKAFRDSVEAVMAKVSQMSETERDQFFMPNMKHDAGHHVGEVTFPYAFPKEGNYRIWLQIKRNGKILTGAFDAKVI